MNGVEVQTEEEKGAAETGKWPVSGWRSERDNLATMTALFRIMSLCTTGLVYCPAVALRRQIFSAAQVLMALICDILRRYVLAKYVQVFMCRCFSS